MSDALEDVPIHGEADWSVFNLTGSAKYDLARTSAFGGKADVKNR